jgi:hypothetical protein
MRLFEIKTTDAISGNPENPRSQAPHECPLQAGNEIKRGAFCTATKLLAAFSGAGIISKRLALSRPEICALSSVVEHYLHTVGVAGSKPAARTILQ